MITGHVRSIECLKMRTVIGIKTMTVERENKKENGKENKKEIEMNVIVNTGGTTCEIVPCGVNHDILMTRMTGISDGLVSRCRRRYEGSD